MVQRLKEVDVVVIGVGMVGIIVAAKELAAAGYKVVGLERDPATGHGVVGRNYAGTLGALTYWAIDTLKNKYLKNPGRLVSA